MLLWKLNDVKIIGIVDRVSFCCNGRVKRFILWICGSSSISIIIRKIILVLNRKWLNKLISEVLI